MKEIKSHPFSEIFPLMPPADIKELADDIKQRGLQNPITLYERKILDGRHRYEACLIAEIKPRFDQYKGNDPLGFVIAANLKRRHLTTSQKAMVAASIENLPEGRPSKNDNSRIANETGQINDANLQIARANAADAMSVSPRSVATASKILDESPRLAAQVRDGKITVHAAAEKLAEKKAEEAVGLDKEGHPIPHGILQLWRRAETEARAAMSAISKLRSALSDAEDQKDIIYREFRMQDNIGLLTSVFENFKAVAPHGVCTKCQGKIPKDCPECKGRGFVSALFYKMHSDDRVKAMRAKMRAK